MTRRPAAELPPLVLPVEPDPELEALPAPRRPGRTLTLATMSVTTLLALGMAWAIRGEVTYALRKGAPTSLGNLSELEPRSDLANTWVQGEALLGSTRAVRYERPLEGGDSYRLAPIAGNDRIWVQVRVPHGMEGPRFVPPTSFVGRMIPFSQAGVRYGGLTDAAARASGGKAPSDAWLLIDGEAPTTTRWSLGLVALFVGFAAFNVWGLARLLRPAEG
ncbi:MAG: hypothetical protein IT377_29295 [Polyangiaceae bacterium]|nr:hypothetical protein [Polyangiaceae bacterium]